MLTTTLRAMLPRRAIAANRAFSTTAQRAVFARMTLIGRLGAAPEEHTSANGTSMVRMVVATSRTNKEAQKTSWFHIASFSEYSRDFLLGLPKG
jgi:hypothetical protein